MTEEAKQPTKLLRPIQFDENIKAGILNHSSCLATGIPAKQKLYDDPAATTEYEDLIINALLKARNCGPSNRRSPPEISLESLK